MPHVTPDDRLHKLALRLTAQAKPWSSFHPYRIKLDREEAGTRGCLITFKAVDGDLAVTVCASLEGAMVSVHGSASYYGTKGELDLTGGFSQGGRAFEGADKLAERLGGQVEEEFAWMESERKVEEATSDRETERRAREGCYLIVCPPVGGGRPSGRSCLTAFGSPTSGTARSRRGARTCPWICPWPVALPQATP